MTRFITEMTFDFFDKLSLAKAKCPVCGKTIRLERKDGNKEYSLPRFLVGNNFIYEQALKICNGNEYKAKQLATQKLEELENNQEKNISIRLFNRFYTCPDCKTENIQIDDSYIKMLIYDGIYRNYSESGGDFELLLTHRHIDMAKLAKVVGVENVLKEIASHKGE